MEKINKDIKLSLDGIGIAIYSKGCMSDIEDGKNFFNSDLAQPKKAATHICKGDITCFCTGSSGDYLLKIRDGYPDNLLEKEYDVEIRLGLEVKNHVVSFVDIFWLMEWDSDIIENQQIELEDGFYHLTILTKLPEDGYCGSNQVIYIYFKKLDKMPELRWNGVPQLFKN